MLITVFAVVELENKQKDKFREIYQKYKNLLFIYAKNIVEDSYDAEDVLQNAFIRIAKNIDSIGSIEDKETVSFLIIITKSAAYDFLRKKSRCKEIDLDEALQIAGADGVIEELISKLNYEKIVLCIKKIPSPYMEVLYFHYVKDYSINKTAKLLNRKIGTVKMQLVRGKKILIKELSEVLYG